MSMWQNDMEGQKSWGVSATLSSFQWHPSIKVAVCMLPLAWNAKDINNNEYENLGKMLESELYILSAFIYLFIYWQRSL